MRHRRAEGFGKITATMTSSVKASRSVGIAWPALALFGAMLTACLPLHKTEFRPVVSDSLDSRIGAGLRPEVSDEGLLLAEGLRLDDGLTIPPRWIFSLNCLGARRPIGQVRGWGSHWNCLEWPKPCVSRGLPLFRTYPADRGFTQNLSPQHSSEQGWPSNASMTIWQCWPAGQQPALRWSCLEPRSCLTRSLALAATSPLLHSSDRNSRA